MFQQVFPYLNTPLAGSPNDLSLTITLQHSAKVNGPFVDAAVKYDSVNQKLSSAMAGANAGFYRVRADRAGVKLSSPTVQGTNVLIGVEAP
jgi:hypothetical protein